MPPRYRQRGRVTSRVQCASLGVSLVAFMEGVQTRQVRGLSHSPQLQARGITPRSPGLVHRGVVVQGSPQMQPRGSPVPCSAQPFAEPGSGYDPAGVGASSIALLKNCVRQAQQLPAGKQPSSQKWAARLETATVNVRLGSSGELCDLPLTL